MPENVIQMPPTSLALTVPSEFAEIIRVSDQVAVAQNYEITTDTHFQFADEMSVELRKQAKLIEDKRLSFTRPIDAIKRQWTDWFGPAITTRRTAAGIYDEKKRAYTRKRQEEADRAAREAEEAARKERERLEAEAREREATARRERERLEAEARAEEERAAQLKTQAAKDRALQRAEDARHSAAAVEEQGRREAEEVRTAAAMIPTEIEPSAAMPVTTASNVARTWKADVKDPKLFLAWLVQHPEWVSVISWKPAELNRLAKQFAGRVPGLKAEQVEQYRAKGR